MEKRKSINTKNKCKSCENYFDFYGQDIKCQKHRKPDKNGYYLVGCRRCDEILKSDDSQDNLCIKDI